MSPREVHPAGDVAFLLDCDGPAEARALDHWLRGQPLAERAVEIIPSTKALFVRARDRASRRAIAAALANVDAPDAPTIPRTMVLPVRYDGPDLIDVAERVGLTVRSLITLHTQAEFTVDFFGFTPGLAIMGGTPPEMSVPRLPSPRTRVAPSSVAIANDSCVIYPGGTPGGWHLVGTYVGKPVWNLARTPPNRLHVGDRVLFEEVRC